jgi:hypothetical protein
MHCRGPHDHHPERRDFCRLAARTELHPGLIILPFMDRDSPWHLLHSAIAFLDARGDPINAMINHALHVDATGGMALLAIPAKGP